MIRQKQRHLPWQQSKEQITLPQSRPRSVKGPRWRPECHDQVSHTTNILEDLQCFDLIEYFLVYTANHARSTSKLAVSKEVTHNWTWSKNRKQAFFLSFLQLLITIYSRTVICSIEGIMTLVFFKSTFYKCLCSVCFNVSHHMFW